MASHGEPETPAVPLARHLRGSRSSRRADRIFTSVSLGSGLAVLAVLTGIVVSTTTYAWPAMQREGWGFFTGTTWSSASNTYGALPLVYGTIVTALIALVIAVPMSIGVALFATELCPRRLRGPLVALIDLLAAVPSVVYGLVGLLTFHDPLQRIYRTFAGPSASGSSLLTAGIVVAFMICPVITSITRDVVATVPRPTVDAAWALGATRMEVVRTAILPSSAAGITGAVMLGLGRALGETIAVALVVGSSVQITANVTEPGYTMASIIANTFNGEGNMTNQRALMGLGVVLFAITIVVNVGARVIVDRSQRRLEGTA